MSLVPAISLGVRVKGLLRSLLFLGFLVFCVGALPGCGLGGGGTSGAGGGAPAPGAAAWTWVSGVTTVSQRGTYGAENVAAPTNLPGGRNGVVSWIDPSGNLWLFGGSGFDAAGANGDLNDLWKFDGANWTWVSGTNARDQKGVYGTKNFAASTNVPGGRFGALSWPGHAASFWLFGGTGIDAVGSEGDLNDLWRFDGTNWTWVSGGNAREQKGVYGTKNSPGPSNVPGARHDAVSWTDAAGNFWLFGGSGMDSAGSTGSLDDLWRFDGTNWTWVSGSDTINQIGLYGAKGFPGPTNVPGAAGAAPSPGPTLPGTSGSSGGRASMRWARRAASTTCGGSTARTGPGCRGATPPARGASTARRTSRAHRMSPAAGAAPSPGPTLPGTSGSSGGRASMRWARRAASTTSGGSRAE